MSRSRDAVVLFGSLVPKERIVFKDPEDDPYGAICKKIAAQGGQTVFAGDACGNRPMRLYAGAVLAEASTWVDTVITEEMLDESVRLRVAALCSVFGLEPPGLWLIVRFG